MQKQAEIRDRTIVIVRAECLRRAGIIVQQDTSVNRIVENIAAALDESPLKELVTFEHALFCSRKTEPSCFQIPVSHPTGKRSSAIYIARI